jgi:hypothetical protein
MGRAVEVHTAALGVQPSIAAVPEADPRVSGDAQVTVAEAAVRPRRVVRGDALGDRAIPHREPPQPWGTTGVRWHAHMRAGKSMAENPKGIRITPSWLKYCLTHHQVRTVGMARWKSVPEDFIAELLAADLPVRLEQAHCPECREPRAARERPS